MEYGVAGQADGRPPMRSPGRSDAQCAQRLGCFSVRVESTSGCRGYGVSTEVTVRIPEALRQFAGGSRELRIVAASVEELMAGVMAAGYGALVNHICARDGQLRPFVNLYVGDASIRALDGLRTPLKTGDVVTILPSIAGG